MRIGFLIELKHYPLIVDPETSELEGFALIKGKYEAIEATETSWLWSAQLGLYLGVYEQQLRYFTPERELVLTPEETMTTILTANIAKKTSENEIIFPKGEFWSDEPPLETYLHLQQIILLIKCLEWLWKDKHDYFGAGNLTIYYSPNQKKSEYFRGPDFFVVLGTTRNRARRSWVVWEEEGKYPNVIIEILSQSTRKVDKGEKKQIYQDIFRTPNYFWFDPETLELEGFVLIRGKYEAIEATETGWLWSAQLGLYLGVYEQQLRYFTPERELVLTPEETAIQAQELAQQAQQRVQQLEERLRSLGIEPD